MRQTRRIYRKGKHLILRIGQVRNVNWDAVLTTSVCLLFGLMIVLIHKKIYEMMMYSETYQMKVQQMQATSFPDWADGRVKESIRNDLAGSSISIFDPGLLRKVKNRYESSKWVRRVRRIERDGLSGVNVSIELRRPAAFITDREGRKYLIDRKGVRVPGVYRELPDHFGTVYRIHGYTTQPPEPGVRWRSQRVRDAASVAAVLQDSNIERVLDIHRLELKGSARDWKENEGQIILRTRSEKSVVWGGVNDQTVPWEPSARAKLKNLKRVLKGAPNLKGVQEVKLQFDDPIVSLK